MLFRPKVKWGPRRRPWELYAALAFLAAALLLLSQFAGTRAPLSIATPGADSATRTARLLFEVEGSGAILVNGSAVNATLKLPAGSRVVVEARPADGWRLKSLLMNGTPVASPVTLTVGGNTTVRAVFERAPVILRLASNVDGARALVNGSEVGLPAALKLPWGAVVVVEQLPVEGYAALNGTVVLNASADAEVLLLYRRVGFTARFTNVVVPVWVNVTGRVYSGNFTLPFNGSLAVRVAPYGVDDAGCMPFNATHKVCLYGWLQRSRNETLRVRYLHVNLTGDEEFEQLQVYARARYNATVIEVVVGNATVKTTAKPSDIMLVPFIADYQYVGGGWFHVKGSDWIFYIKMPPWRKIKVYVNYTADKINGAQRVGRLAVVVCNGPVYLDIGTAYGTMPLTAFTIDRTIADIYYKALVSFNYDRGKMELFFDNEREFNKYFLCYNLAENYSCTAGKTMAGPSTRLKPGVEQGDIRFEGSGEAWIRIEVVEQ